MYQFDGELKTISGNSLHIKYESGCNQLASYKIPGFRVQSYRSLLIFKIPSLSDET